MVETRRSTGFFLIFTWMRPSCGSRFSAMLMEPLMILMRLTMADCKRFGGACISWSTPSMPEADAEFFVERFEMDIARTSAMRLD